MTHAQTAPVFLNQINKGVFQEKAEAERDVGKKGNEALTEVELLRS